MALAMVLAVYIWIFEVEIQPKCFLKKKTYTTTRTWTWTGVSNGVVSFALGFGCLAVLEIFTIGLERGHDVELWRSFTGTSTDGSAINHQARAVEAAH
jgi:hypothetical protein